jgi:hypothetical protein
MQRTITSRVRLTLAAAIAASVVPVAAVLAVPQAAGASTDAPLVNTTSLTGGLAALEAELTQADRDLISFICTVPGGGILLGVSGCGLP